MMKKIVPIVLAMTLVTAGIQFNPLISFAEESDLNRNEVSVEDEKNIVSDDIENEEIEDTPVESENKEEWMTDTEDQDEEISLEDNLETELTDNANSWRFVNGQPVQNAGFYGTRAVTQAYHSNATKVGIDVSEWNGIIDWERVKASGIDYAIIRCGYGMNYESQDDDYWLRNVSECERLGIPYGVYIYSYATNTDRALSEAQHVLRLIRSCNLSYPVYFDMEDNSTLGSDLASIAKTFCNTIRNAGYSVGIYANTNWWNTYLTDTCYSQWHRWVAEWGFSCHYSGEYSMWQYSATGRVDGITGNVDMNYQIGYPLEHGDSASIAVSGELKDKITYTANVQNNGWMNEVINGRVAGTVGKAKSIGGIKVAVNELEDVGVEYQVYVEGEGWQLWAADGQETGCGTENGHIEALRIRLTGEKAENYVLYYRTHISNFGWLDWTSGGGAAGSVGYGLPIEAYQIVLAKADSDSPGDVIVPFIYTDTTTDIRARAYVDSTWLDAVGNGEIIGTTGKGSPIYAFRIDENIKNIDLKYYGYSQGEGWEEPCMSGQILRNTVGSGGFETIKIDVSGSENNSYDIFYRVHVSNIGWLGWAMNGESAGTKGYGYAIEAIQIMLLPKSSEYAPIPGEAYLEKPMTLKYRTHVSEVGWQPYAENGTLAGTTGRNLQIEAVQIKLDSQEYEGDIEYCSHVEDIGWQDFVNNGAVSGTEGRNKQIEAIRVRLTGQMEGNYDIYYRVHASEFGWLGWAKNGEPAGSQGYARQIEAMEIQLVAKDAPAPGSMANAFVQKSDIIQYVAHVENIGWQNYVENGALAGTTGQNLQIEAFKIGIKNKICSGGLKYCAHVEDIGWQEEVSEEEIAGTVGNNRQIEAVKINLTGEMAKKYDIYYRVHASEFGWLGWTKNGNPAGSEGYARQIEAIQVKLVEKDGDAPGSTQNSFWKR